MLIYPGISLTQLHFIGSSDRFLKMTTALLQRPCCRGLKVLTINGFAYSELFLDVIMAPIVVPTPSRATVLFDGPSKEQEQGQDQEQDQEQTGPSYSPDDEHRLPRNPEPILRLNTILTMLPSLGDFSLDYYLDDLAVFDGMGRIPVQEDQPRRRHHQQQETEEEEEEEESYGSATLDRLQEGKDFDGGGGEEAMGFATGIYLDDLFWRICISISPALSHY
ncbi:hypothetical protein BGX23_004171 [Mortierella sp. AD031]|nr:hypothetical protein BGX23_004171 [Mortierella sp. AD031]